MNSVFTRPPWRRRQRRLIWLFGALIGVVVLLAAGFKSWLQLQSHWEYNRLQAAGFPATDEEMRAFSQQGLALETEVSGFAEAMKRLSEDWFEPSYRFIRDELDKQREAPRLSTEARQWIREYLAQNEEALQLLRDTIQCPDYRVMLQPCAEPPQYMRGMLIGGHAFAFEAQLAAENGDVERAAAALLNILKLTHLFANNSNGFLPIYRWSVRRTALEAFERTLAVAFFSNLELFELQTAFHEADDENELIWALVVERLEMLSQYARPRFLIRDSINNPLWRRIPGAPGLFAHVMDMGGWIERDRLDLLRAMNRLIFSGQAPEPAFVLTLRAMHETWVQRPRTMFRISDIVLHDVFFSSQGIVADRTLMRAAETAAAVERYWLMYGQPPAQAEDLVPFFVDAVRTSLFGAKPLTYAVLNNGYVISFHYPELPGFETYWSSGGKAGLRSHVFRVQRP